MGNLVKLCYKGHIRVLNLTVNELPFGGRNTTVGGKSTGRLKTLCTLPPPPPQHTEAQFKVPDGGIKSTFTVLLLFIIGIIIILALFHSIFSLLVHSFFGTVS